MQIICKSVFRPIIPTIDSPLFDELRLSEGDRMDVTLSDDAKWFKCGMYGTGLFASQGGEGYASRTAAHEWPLRVPERRKILPTTYTMREHWEFATTDITALLIYSLWPKDRVEFTDEARIVYDFLLQRLAFQTSRAYDRARYQMADDHMREWYVREILPRIKFVDNAELPLTIYQKVGLCGCIHQEASALFMEQGTGKTPVVIARICNEALEINNHRTYMALIVCPKGVMTNWRNEFLRFATVKGRIALLRGSQLERVKRLVDVVAGRDSDERWAAVICSYETVAKSWDAIRMMGWDLCVLDESHYIKSTYAKRHKQMLQLRDLCRQRMVLTGTPITNTMMDLYSQLEFLGEGLSGFTSISRFRLFYGKWVRQEGTNLNMMVGYQNIPIIQERLARLAYIIRKADALPELPDKVYDVVDIEMSSEQATYYEKIQKQLSVEIQGELDSDKSRVLIVNNILTMLLRLSQVTSGIIRWQDAIDATQRGVDRLDPNPKLDTLVEMLKEKGPLDKTIVWCCWVDAIKFIRARLELEKIDAVTFYGGVSDHDREVAVDRFNNDPACRVFIGNPAAGGTGLNLLGHGEGSPDTDCSHVIYYAMNWSSVQRSQSADRSHRMGTRTHVRYTDLCVPDSIDSEIRERVVAKQAMAFQIQDIKDIIARLLWSVGNESIRS